MVLAQRVLNACEGEKLDADGDLGAKTRAALTLFRQKYGIGSGSALTIPPRWGSRSARSRNSGSSRCSRRPARPVARTREELAAFRAQRGLGFDAKLDAATRRALTDALAQHTGAFDEHAAYTCPDASTDPAHSRGQAADVARAGRGPDSAERPSAYRKFRPTLPRTTLANQVDEPAGAVTVPVLDDDGHTLAQASPSFFAKLSLEGTGRAVHAACST